MECKKCKKNCMESELTNGFCQDCLSNKSYKSEKVSNSDIEFKQIAINVLISSIISCILSVVIILSLSGKFDELNINDFKLSEPTYLRDEMLYGSVSYSGETKVTCKDKKGTYLIIYSRTLVSGGNYESIGKTEYSECIVHNGEGTITTYDYCDEKYDKEPTYVFKILGYRSFY